MHCPVISGWELVLESSGNEAYCMSDAEDLLRCLIHIMGRSAVPVEEVREIVGNGKNRSESIQPSSIGTAL